MIKQYGADTVNGLFYPIVLLKKTYNGQTKESTANKFLQKIWNLNNQILKNKSNKSDNKIENKFELEINNYVNKVDLSIKNFRFNVTVAYFYEIYNLFKNYLELNVKKDVFEKNIIKVMKLMIPFTPHLAYECLDLFNCKDINQWPDFDKKRLLNDIKLAVQVNGKTRDIITIKKDLLEKEISNIVLKNQRQKNIY